VLRAGTVLDTSGGPDFVRIFHAGFHDPDDWLTVPSAAPDAATLAGELGGSRGADYFTAIGSCIAQVLDAAVAQKLSSVAFPLIGCGLFGLDEKMLILQFLDAIEALDDRLAEGESLHVWLVIRDPGQFESAAGVFLDLLLQERSKMARIRLKTSGVPILDRFAARLSQRTNEDWAKWLLCRYAEIAVELMCYALCRATRPATAPESRFKGNWSGRDHRPLLSKLIEPFWHIPKSILPREGIAESSELPATPGQEIRCTREAHFLRFHAIHQPVLRSRRHHSRSVRGAAAGRSACRSSRRFLSWMSKISWVRTSRSARSRSRS
jgi:hypothetical protein